MIKYMLDTDISIYILRRKPIEVKRMFNIHSGEIAISSVTLGELAHGVEKSKHPHDNLESLIGFVGRLEIISYDESAAYQFGQLRHELKDQKIGPYDFMIAAHARSLGLTLVTNNTNEFKRVAGLQIENWVNS